MKTEQSGHFNLTNPIRVIDNTLFLALAILLFIRGIGQSALGGLASLFLKARLKPCPTNLLFNKILFFVVIISLFILFNFALAQNPIFPNPANWDTTRIYSQASGTLQKIAIGNKLKGVNDDTFRIATGQSPLNRNAIILTDTSSMPPMRWRADIPFTGDGNNGVVSVAIGDVDGDGINEIIFGQAGGNLKRVKWVSNSWNVAQIDSQGGQVYDIAIGDADNNGATDIIFARYNYVFRSYWTGSAWSTTQIWSGDGSLCHGVAIGDFDTIFTGNEIVVTTAGGRVVRIRWNGSSWDYYILYYNSICNFYDPAIADFDTSNLGNEIVFGNGNATINNGSVIELYGSGNNWQIRAIYTPTGTNEAHQNLAVGDVLDEHNGIEIVSIGIRGSAADSIRVLYGSGTNWNNQVIIAFPLVPTFGIAVGDVNKYRDYKQEIVFARNTILYEAEQRIPPGPNITDISHNPLIPLFNETVTVRAKILDSLTIIADSLYYAINNQSNWQSIPRSHLDSFYYYSILAQDTGTVVYYFLIAKNIKGGRSQSPIFSYSVALEHSIYQIQHTFGPSDTSPDNNRYVHTKGIVTGVFGRFFNIEEEPGSAWRGIHIRRPAISDTLPYLTIGDSISVLGRVGELANQTVLNVFYDSGGWVQRIGSNFPLPCTTFVPISQIAESLEGTLILIDTVRFKTSGIFQPNTVYWAYNFAETCSIPVFIRSETNIPNESIPNGYLLLTGCLNQYINQYQVMPRMVSDLNELPVDFGAEEILSPPETCNYGTSITPKVIIRNYQMTPVANLSVWLRIGNNYNNERFFSRLAPKPYDTIEFNPWSGNPGWQQIKAWTKLRNDRNPNNDTVIDSVYVQSASGGFWAERKNLPLGAGKNVKQGGALVYTRSDTLFAFKGNNTTEFYAYNTTTDTWIKKESLPLLALKPKRVKRGGALTYDKWNNKIYALKGNNSREFWQYDLSKDSWSYLGEVPSAQGKGVKGGSGLGACKIGQNIYLYFIKGSKTNEFYAYDVSTKTWRTDLKPIPLLPSGKPMKDGSCMVVGGDYIYCLKGGYNDFYAYSVDSDTWLIKKSLPLYSSIAQKKKKAKDGAGLCYDDTMNLVYCLKGGNTQEFWVYYPDLDTWVELETIPKGLSNKRVKSGGALTNADGLVFALKGNNTRELWCYTPKPEPHRVFQMSLFKPKPCPTEIITNPKGNTIKLKSDSNPRLINYDLYNVLGKKVKGGLLEAIQGSSFKLVDTKGLPSGVYILRINLDKTKITRKIIISR